MSGPCAVPTRSRFMTTIRSGQCAGSAKSVWSPRCPSAPKSSDRTRLRPIFYGDQAFAADDESCSERQPEGAIGDVGESCVNPKLVVWKGAGEIATKLEMIANTFDGIEVGD